MFESLKKVLIICVKGTLDLILGVTTAAFISEMFPPLEKQESIPRLLAEIFLQNAGTLLIGLEARSLIFSDEDAMTSPYGIAFMMALYLQKGFFEKIFSLQKQLTEKVYENTNPGTS